MGATWELKLGAEAAFCAAQAVPATKVAAARNIHQLALLHPRPGFSVSIESVEPVCAKSLTQRSRRRVFELGFGFKAQRSQRARSAGEFLVTNRVRHPAETLCTTRRENVCGLHKFFRPVLVAAPPRCELCVGGLEDPGIRARRGFQLRGSVTWPTTPALSSALLDSGSSGRHRPSGSRWGCRPGKTNDDRPCRKDRPTQTEPFRPHR
jgi:hypothetical protein